MRSPISTKRAAALALAGAALALALSAPAAGASSAVTGPKQHYLALGDSLAFGGPPGSDTHGYVTDLFAVLQGEGTKDVTNYGCPGETTATFINGGCPSKFAPPGFVQLAAAVAFLQAHPGKVSPVTLSIGAEVARDIDPRTCTINVSGFNADLAAVDANLTGTILPALRAALTVNGRVTGSIVMMNYYDPYQNICPNTVPFTKSLNQHLANDASGLASIVDVFTAFGGSGVPNPDLCRLTLMCVPQPLGPNIHPTNEGYSVIADTFAAAIPPD
jgi:lysophospholipase L1-like esterase